MHCEHSDSVLFYFTYRLQKVAPIEAIPRLLQTLTDLFDTNISSINKDKKPSKCKNLSELTIYTSQPKHQTTPVS